MHTPRPWWVQRSRFFRASVWAESALGAFAVARGIYYDSDARLIAAAPDLHGALATLVGEAAAKGVELQSLPAARAVLAKLLTDAEAAHAHEMARDLANTHI